MSTIPGVTATTTVVSNVAQGNASAVGCFIGGSDIGTTGIVYTFTTFTQASSSLGSTTAYGKLINMISYAFLNGAKEVKAICAASTGAPSDLAYTQALAVALLADGIDYVVVEGTSAAVKASLKTHLQTAVTEGKYRRGYCGNPAGTSVASIAASAQAVAYDRQFVCGPNFLDNNGSVLTGGETAAICGSLAEANDDPALPRTRAVATGVSGIETSLLISDYDTLHNAGVLTTYTKNGDTGIMRYLTTYVGTSGIKEGTITLQRDYVQNNLIDQLEVEFRQTKVTARTLAQIKASVLGKLRDWQSKEIVSPDHPVTCIVTQDATDPSKVNVEASYWAVYPLNFISLSLILNI